MTFKMADVLKLVPLAFTKVTADKWRSCCKHVKDIEKKYWAMDIAVEAEMERLVITVCSSDEDTDTASEDTANPNAESSSDSDDEIV